MSSRYRDTSSVIIGAAVKLCGYFKHGLIRQKLALQPTIKIIVVPIKKFEFIINKII